MTLDFSSSQIFVDVSSFAKVLLNTRNTIYGYVKLK